MTMDLLQTYGADDDTSPALAETVQPTPAPRSSSMSLAIVPNAAPDVDVFGVSGWLDTTFVDEHIRICRGNRGSVFVLTRRPLARTPANSAAVV